jgi:hypothetical protein
LHLKKNGTKFNATLCGEAFETFVLAVAISWSIEGESDTLQCGIVFNSNDVAWDVYPGLIDPVTIDFQRVAVHELGHCVGLDHEEEDPAIMFPSVGNIAMPTYDDVAGVRSLHPEPVTAPANNNFESAAVISGTSGFVVGGNVNASRQAGEPFHANEFGGGAPVWWQWTAPADGSMTIDTTGSFINTVLAVYTGDSFVQLLEVTSNDDFSGQSTSPVSFDTVAGQTYKIAVDGTSVFPIADTDPLEVFDTGGIRLNYRFLDKSEDLAADFGASGLRILSGGAWSPLHPLSGEDISVANFDNGGTDDAAVDFGPGFGIWTLLNSSNWISVHSLSPESMVAGNIDNAGGDDLILDFGPGFGLWARMNNASWSQLHSLSPNIVTAGNIDNKDGDDLVVDFGPPFGIWVLRNNFLWTQVHALSAEIIVTKDIDNVGGDDILIDFGPGFGLWARLNDALWVPLYDQSPVNMGVGNLDSFEANELIADFGGNGIWALYNFGFFKVPDNWQILNASSAESFAVGNIDGKAGDDLIGDFGGSGLWALINNSGWSLLDAASPGTMDTGEIDNN